MKPATLTDRPIHTLTPENLAELNAWLETQTAEGIIRWAHERFGNRVAVLSAFQKAGCTVCHQIAALNLQNDIEVVFVDTGVNFRETIETVDRIESEYGLRVVRLRPERTMAEQVREEGVLYLSTEGQKRCCFLRKKEPLKQIKGRYDALIGSLRRSSGGKRAMVPVVAVDRELNLLRIHPIFNWGQEDLDNYMEQNQVIYNPLHDQGYPTIGCDRCTSPVVPGESERSGRWRHLDNAVQYCNINPTDYQI